MASIVSKTVDGYGPYLYKVTYNAATEKQNWEFLGKAGSVDEEPGPVPDDYQPDTARAVNGVTRSRVDDPAAAALLDDLDGDDAAGTYEDLVDALAVEGSKAYDSGDMRSLLNLMDTDDEELADAIDTIQTERKSNSLGTRTRTTKRIPASEDEVRDALDTIEEKIGVRPGEIAPGPSSGTTLTNTDIQMPTDADASADLLNGVVSSVTESWSVEDPDQQAAVQDAIEGIVGAGAVQRVKQEADDPDSLGFAHPDTIPTNGDKQGKTPVTDLYGVGPATATENHPDGDKIALEDYGDLSKLQRERVRVDVDHVDNDDAFADTIETVTGRADPTAALVGGLQMSSSDIEELYASDENDVLAVGPTGENWGVIDQDNLSDVTNVEKDEDLVRVENEDGGETPYTRSYWEFIEAAVDGDVTERARAGDGYVAEVPLGNGDSAVLPPTVEDE